MTGKDRFMLTLLAFLGVLIWVRDLRWLTFPEDSLPILLGFPLFLWLGRPWSFRPRGSPMRVRVLVLAVVLFTLGALFDFTLLLVLGWATLFWDWLHSRLGQASLPRVRQLLVLPVLSFPWIILDGQAIGWWFRLSGAWVAGHIFSSTGFDVSREGTFLVVQNLPVDIGAPCSGLNTLQAMLMAGAVVAYLELGGRNRYWWNLPLMVPMAWMANTLRIVAICAAALAVSAEFAMGLAHTLGGWLVICVMFFLCWALFAAQRTRLSGGATLGHT